MSEQYVQARVEIEGHDLRVARLEGAEALSAPYRFELDVVAAGHAGDPEPDPEGFVGATAAILFEEDGAVVRRVTARVVAARDHLDAGLDHARYHLSLAPEVHAVGMVETYEVFLDKSVPDIIRIKLERAGLRAQDMAFKLSGRYPTRDFVLQYRETDLAFVSRLAEHVGIAYRFDPREGRDVVVFSDTNENLDVPAVRVPYDPRADGRGIRAIERSVAAFPGRVVLDDYTDQHPKLDLVVEHVVDPKYAGEVVEWAPGYATTAEGAGLAAVRAQERVCMHRFYRGQCTQPLAAGDVVEVVGHPRLADARLRVTDVQHAAVQGTQWSAPGEARKPYLCAFRAVPAGTPYRPERRTPKPRIDGLVHAITEPGPGGVAQLDAQGRYTVQFLFDRADAKRRRVSSARVRMMQSHAGPGYGIHFPLKPEIEVLVAFIDGDPDRPVIAGCVPNVLTPSPVTSRNPLMHRIETLSGVYIRMKDS